MGSQIVRQVSAVVGAGALIASGAILAGCGKSGQPTAPVSTTTTTVATTTSSVTSTEKNIGPNGSQTFTPTAPEHRGNVG